MKHELSSITAINFKSIKNCEFKLSSYTPLVGYNNAGKSNIINAIKWLLQKSSLSQDGFNDPNSPVIVIGVISGITDEILDFLEQKHKKSIKKYIDGGKLTIRRYQEKPNVKSTEVKLHVKRLDSDNPEDMWNSNPAGIDQAIIDLFPEPIHVGAMENAEEDVSKYKTSSTIGKLLGKIIEPIERSYGDTIKQRLKEISNLLDADSDKRALELEEFDAAMNNKIDVFFKGINVKVHVPTPELRDVFNKGTLKVFEQDRIGGKDVSSLGHGAQRSIQMALIQHLAEMQKNEDNTLARTLLLIDEPELYLHPQAIEVVRDALLKLSHGNYQIVFSTHSPILITEKEIPNTILVRKNNAEGTHTKHTLREAVERVILDKVSQTRLLFSLTNSSKILFCEKVILTEGKTELRLLPILFHEIMGYSLGSAKVALIEQNGSGNTKNSMQILNTMGMTNKSIVDLDYAFVEAIKHDILDVEDDSIVECKKILLKIAQEHDVILDEGTGLPKKSNTISASAVYALLAKHEDAVEHINNLHEKLKGHNIWLWTRGAVEDHLGIEGGKNENAWSNFAQAIIDKGVVTSVRDYNSVTMCFDWIMEN